LDKLSNPQSNSIKDKFLFIIALACFLLFFSFVIFFSVFPSKSNQPTPINPAHTEHITNTQEETFQQQTALRRGDIGFSEDTDLVEDSQKEAIGDGAVKYTFESQNPNRSDMIIVKNGIILFARHAVVGTETSDGYKNLLGKQDDTISGPTFYGANTSVYFYEEGTALIVDPKTNTTYEEFTFQPAISIEEFKEKYKVYTQ
jgi:hypothetical protein